MASAYVFAMLAVTPSESREVALIANPEFEAGRVAGHRARRLIGEKSNGVPAHAEMPFGSNTSPMSTMGRQGIKWEVTYMILVS
jgi:hypothetical protein